MTTKSLILASSSTSRKKLLERLLIPFETLSPDIDETVRPNETPSQLVIRLAKEKAQKVANQFPRAYIIGADQVGVLDNHIIGKPQNQQQAMEQLLLASGNRMRFYIGVCLLDSEKQTQEIIEETYDVIFRKLTLDKIKKYLAKEQPYECAGSCKAEGLGITLIEKFSGDDFTALIGLPLIRLTEMLERAGLNVLA